MLVPITVPTTGNTQEQKPAVAAGMSVPGELQYTETHEWVRREGDTATVGITDHAQAALGDVQFVELPEEGATFDAGDAFGTIESDKVVSDLIAPIGGEIVEVNSALDDAPEKVNEDPYGDGWMIRLNEENLLSAEEYAKMLETLMR
jgi:glycine cleavage system H protein